MRDRTPMRGPDASTITADNMLIVGLMSGTSADGIDAALVRIEGDVGAPVVTVQAFQTRPWDPDMRVAILDLAAGKGGPREVSEMRVRLAEGFAAATNDLLRVANVSPAEVSAIGCHGQTVRHDPPVRGERDEVGPASPGQVRLPPIQARDAASPQRGFTLQLLDPATLAALTGIPGVHDFRSADMAAGGEGAPLVAWPDRLLFGDPTRTRAVLNLGGIANVTLLVPGRGGVGVVDDGGTGTGQVRAGGLSGADTATDPASETAIAPEAALDKAIRSETELAFDIGPANALMDIAVERATGGRQHLDANGARAAAGTVDPALLAELLADPFFQQPPPRSTGRERFGPELVDRLIADRGLVADAAPEAWNDLLATLAEFTAQAIADVFARYLAPAGVDQVLVAGGGVHNRHLMSRIADLLAPLKVLAARDELGLDPDAREAAAFALLAWAFLNGVPGNVPGATGAAGPRVLGSWTPAPGRGGRITMSWPSRAGGRSSPCGLHQRHLYRCAARGRSTVTVTMAEMHRGRVVNLDADLAIAAADLSAQVKPPMAASIMWTQDSDFEGIPSVEYRAKRLTP